MQRYSGCSGGISNNAVGGASARDTARAESSFSPSNFTLNPRRPSHSQLAPYKLKCDKDPLNCRLGPPDFFPQTPNCPEETLTKEYLQSGYRETVEGIEEAREIVLTQVGSLKHVIPKCKEAIRKRLRAINESRAQKRKAGQVYGVPLSGPLLIKPGVFPEQRPCSEDFRRKWIEGLSQPYKRLRSLADQIPHGYRRKSLFEVLIRHNVPLLRATWFIKITYLNQVRPASTSVSSGAPDKLQFARTELWTKDVIEYLQHLLDEFFSKDGLFPVTHVKDQSSPTLLAGPMQQRSDSSSGISDAEEPSLQFKWWYMVRLLQWHYAEGLLLPSLIIEWVLNKLQEKESAEDLELLLPVIFDLVESVALSQTYVRTFVDVAGRSINDLSPGGSDLIRNTRMSSLATALTEMLRYLILAVPDTFVALDCFPLPTPVVPDVNSSSNSLKIPDVGDRVQYDTHDAYHRYLSFGYVVSSLQKRAANLAKIVNPTLQGRGVAKVVQALDKAQIVGDVRFAYNSLFEDLSDMVIEEGWTAEVSPCLWSSLKWIGTVSLSLICSVFFLCEWATCDYRDYRTACPEDLKFTGRKDFSQVYIAVFLLKLKMEEILNLSQSNNGSPFVVSASGKPATHDNFSGGTTVDNVSAPQINSKRLDEKKNKKDILQSPGPLHDIVVCWLDQHEVGKGEGFKRLQLLIMELIRYGIFYPQAYVRQLIVSGIMDRNVTSLDLDKQRRHYRILKQLPGFCLFDVLEDARVAEVPLLHEAVRVYSNERQLVLNGLLGDHSSHFKTRNGSCFSGPQKQKDHSASVRDGASPILLESRRNCNVALSSSSLSNTKGKGQVAELKAAISTLLQLPNSCPASIETRPDESKAILKGSLGIKIDMTEGTPGCEECRRAKRQKLSDERSSSFQGFSSNPSDDEDTWWVRKGHKSLELIKSEPPVKSTKNASRGRRKTQSLAQLAAARIESSQVASAARIESSQVASSARIESSQGASTSHVCDNKVSCPHHRSSIEVEIPKEIDRIKTAHLSDIGKTLKQLRWLEKRSISIWLLTSIRQLVEGNEKAASKVSRCTGALSPPLDDRNAVRWRLGEDELSVVLYLLDISSDLISAVKFLLWLLPKIPGRPSSNIHAGRNIMMLPKNKENHVCEVGEAFLISSLQRYENVLVATDLLPEALTSAMNRAVALMTSSGRSSGSVAFAYARNLLKKYGNVPSVTKWEKNFKATCDQRLLGELDAGRDGDLGFSFGVPAGVEDFDEYLRQKISGRISRAAPSMKEIVQRHVEEAVHYFYGKERKPFATSTNKSPSLEKCDEGYQIAQKIVLGLVDCIRQNGGVAQEVDPSIVASAVSAIVSNVGPAIAKLPDFTTNSNYPNFSSTASSLNCVRHILHIHITCLCLLKEALGERLSRIFEITLAAEASSTVSGAFVPGKAPRSQFHLSPETHDINPSHPNEILINSAKTYVGRAGKAAAAAVSALVIGAIVHGVASLERMVTVFKLKEGLDVLQFIRSARSSSNGISRSIGTFKLDQSIEVYVHWFRLLVGNCRTVFDGLVAKILGESYALALSRMQRMLPFDLVFPPAYSIFAMVIWRPYILSSNIATREDIQLYQNLSFAIGDAIRHQPFRDLCLRDTRAFYDRLSSDVGDSEFAAMLELHSPDKHLKTMAFVPLRARLFLNTIIDCKMPPFTLMQDDGLWVPGPSETRAYAENEKRLLDQLVHVLDTLQPAKFHWQWVELRLLLNEQSLIEKIETHNMSLVEAIRSLSPNAENFALSENERNFIEIVLTRLLVRPDAAPLYSEVVHLLGRSLEESLLLHAKWFLAGNDVLLGRKSIRQRLVNIAQLRGLSTKAQYWKLWGWSTSIADAEANRGDKRKLEAFSLEEGEVVDEGVDIKRSVKMSSQLSDVDGFVSSQQYITEKALAELVLPCIDRSSSESRNSFATELIKMMSTIDQQITTLTRGGSKQVGAVPSGVDGSSNKGSSRKGMRGGSPGLGRRLAGVTDSAPPSAAALKASMWLRLQFLLRLLPVIYTDRELSVRNMRHMLASIILRLLGTRIVYEDADLSFSTTNKTLPKRDMETLLETSITASLDLSGESLFDKFLCVLHGLLSNCKPSWLKPKSAPKSTVKPPRDASAFDREVAESLQTELDRMELPATIRRRIQAALPTLPPSLSFSLSCHPPTLSSTALTSLQSSTSTPGLHQGNPNTLQRASVPSTRPLSNTSSRSKSLPSQDPDMEIDPWTLLEDGAGYVSASSNSSNTGSVGGDPSNLRACSWLKGAMRVRRTDLTYVGAMDDDS